MASSVSIANAAATRIGTASRITSLDDNRTVARALKSVWDLERQAVIRDGSWNFAARREALAAITGNDQIIYPWSYAYELPALALRLIEVLDQPIGAAFQLEGRTILADQAAPLYVRYSIDVPELAEWDALAADAFALRLAWRVGHKLAGSAFDRDACWAEYRDAIGKAKSVDAIENPRIEQEECEFINARSLGI